MQIDPCLCAIPARRGTRPGMPGTAHPWGHRRNSRPCPRSCTVVLSARRPVALRWLPCPPTARHGCGGKVPSATASRVVGHPAEVKSGGHARTSVLLLLLMAVTLSTSSLGFAAVHLPATPVPLSRLWPPRDSLPGRPRRQLLPAPVLRPPHDAPRRGFAARCVSADCAAPEGRAN